MSSRAGGNSLNMLLTMGRHSMISTFVLSQKLRAMGSLLRVNAQALIVFRLRNKLELDAVIEELSAVYDNKNTYGNVPDGSQRQAAFLLVH